jgi:RluA family pseudouridine synthase
LAKLFRGKEIKLAGKAAKSEQAAQKGEQITVFLPDPRRNFVLLTGCQLIHEDENLIAINKAAGVTSVPGIGTRGASLVEAAEKLFELKLHPVHRLDRDTSGVIVFAKNADTAKKLEAEFRARRTAKIYHAVVSGIPKVQSSWIREPLRRRGEKVIIDAKNGQTAETRFELVQKLGRDRSLLRLEPRTGRTHQIRVHLASLGLPIIGDATYGTADPALKRHLLHASELQILDYRFQAELPVEFSVIPVQTGIQTI